VKKYTWASSASATGLASCRSSTSASASAPPAPPTAVTAYEIRQADFQKLIALKPQACIKLLMAIVSAFGQKVVDNKDALRSLLTK